MADLESRLMGDQTVSYVSDSDDDDEGNVGNLDPEKATGGQINDLSSSTPRDGPQTGPKGVLQDYKQYKNICRIEEQQASKDKIALYKKTAFTADPNKHPETKEEENSDDEYKLDEEDGEFMREYHEKRLAQLRKEMEEKINKKMPQFGQLFELNSSDELLQVIEKEDKATIVVIHLYDASLEACTLMNKCLECLSQQYRHVKFCKVLTVNAGLSLQFKLNALPALQVYKGGSLIGNYIKMKDHLDQIFYTADVENFLIEQDVFTPIHGVKSNYDDFDIIEE